MGNTSQVKLVSRDPISPDSYLFTFQFLDPNESLALQPIYHIVLKSGQNLQGSSVSRKYTPTHEEQGKFSIPIKIYRPNTHPDYPQGGQLTPYLEKVPLNTIFEIRKRQGKLRYINGAYDQKFSLSTTPKVYHTIWMVCGGSGITPGYQLIKTVSSNPSDNTNIILLYANRTEQDIWLKSELDAYAAKHKNIQIHYTVDKPSPDWKGYVGHCNIDMFKQIFTQKVDAGIMGLRCGPKGMKAVVIDLYKQMGLQNDQIIKF